MTQTNSSVCVTQTVATPWSSHLPIFLSLSFMVYLSVLSTTTRSSRLSKVNTPEIRWRRMPACHSVSLRHRASEYLGRPANPSPPLLPRRQAGQGHMGPACHRLSANL